jgi:hypothetical protein
MQQVPSSGSRVRLIPSRRSSRLPRQANLYTSLTQCLLGCAALHSEDPMDAVFIGLGAALVAATFALLELCRRLSAPRSR